MNKTTITIFLLLIALFAGAVAAQRKTGRSDPTGAVFKAPPLKKVERGPEIPENFPCADPVEAARFARRLREIAGADIRFTDIAEYLDAQAATDRKSDNLWTGFIKTAADLSKIDAFSRAIVEQQGDEALALFVSIEAVAAGYRGANGSTEFNRETIFFAGRARAALDADQALKIPYSFAPFENRAAPTPVREDLSAWLDFTVGVIYSARLGQKEQSLPFLYRAAQTSAVFRRNPFIYALIGEYFIDRAAADDSGGSLERSLELSRINAERALDAMGRACRFAETRSEREKFCRVALDLYRFRFNLAPADPARGADDYIDRLIERPFPDPTN